MTLHVDSRNLKLVSRVLATLVLAATVTVASPVRAIAQHRPGNRPDTRDDATGSTADELKEKTIYIPYHKLRDVFEREGRGVFLPYSQFRSLWEQARHAAATPPEAEPPVDALITEISSDATVSGDVVRVDAQVHAEVLSEGWHEMPLRLGDAAITSATIANEPARIVPADGGGYRWLFEKTGPKPQRVELVLQYAKAYTKSPGRNSVSFEAPRAPVSRWSVRIPQRDVKVDIHPLIAATEVPGGGTGRSVTPENETVVLAFVGAAESVRIGWTPRSEGATGLTALATVDAVQHVRIDEGVVRSTVSLDYSVTRAALDKLAFDVPATQNVVNVFDANIRRWSVAEGPQTQKIEAELFEPARGSQSVVIELERFSGNAASDGDDDVTVPVVRALGVGRQQGTVAVTVAEGLRVEVIRRTGLQQLDAAELPKLRGYAPVSSRRILGYRYAAVPFDLALQVKKIAPWITTDTFIETYLDPDHVTLQGHVFYEIEKAGVFRLELDLPSDYQLRGVRGLTHASFEPATIESYHVDTGGSGRLIVNLRRKALGKVGLVVDLRKRLREPDLAKPTGNSVEVPIGLVRTPEHAVERATGRLVVFAPKSLRVSLAESQGLRSVPISEALKGMEQIARHRDRGLAFAFAEQPARLSVRAERRKPHITARQLLTARIDSGVVKYAATFFYDIQYSGVDRLRIDVPTDLADSIFSSIPGITESKVDPPPGDLADDYIALGLRGESSFLGAVKATLTWETNIDPLEIGKSARIDIPRLKPMNVNRAWGQIVLAKAETIDLRATGGDDSDIPTGVRPIDPAHDLMDGAREADSWLKSGSPAGSSGAARAFEFHDDWVLSVLATRYRLEELKRSSIERAFVRTVVTRSNQLSVQALYRMLSARQRLEVTLPEGVRFDTDPVRINGTPVSLERGREDEYFVPLVGRTPDTPFVLEIRYTVPEGGTLLTLPVFPSEPAVQKMYLGAYIPPERVLLGSRGP
ncbi:MAG: hypothetical protein PVI86_15905, partial [Phycisphaerae bacterium]